MATFMSRLIRLVMVAAALLVAAAAMLYLVGGNSRTYSAAVQIEAARETVFACLIDPEQRPQWSHEVARVERLSDGAPQPGFQLRITRRTAGRDLTTTEEILESKPPDSLLTESQGPLDVVRAAFLLRSGSQGKTVVDYTLIVKARGLGRLTAPFSGDQVTHHMRSELDKLKQLAQSAPRLQPAMDPPSDVPKEESSEGSEGSDR